MTRSPEEPRETRLARAFVELADTLVDDYDVADVLHQLVEYCVDLLDVTAAGLMFTDQRGTLRALASSSERTRMLDLFQLQTDQGPCLDCVRSGEPILVDDLASRATRWPAFVPEAIRQGFVAVHAIPMRLRRQTIGALNLFGTERRALSGLDLQVARALADTATIGILQERAINRGEILIEQLQTALNSRITIEQAKGVLAAAGHLDMEHAFRRLRSYARDTNRRLTDVAGDIATGALDPNDVLTLE